MTGAALCDTVPNGFNMPERAALQPYATRATGLRSITNGKVAHSDFGGLRPISPFCEMVKDPECGAYVAVDGSISVRDGEKVHRFCSYECRDKFLQRLEEGGRELPPREE